MLPVHCDRFVVAGGLFGCVVEALFDGGVESVDVCPVEGFGEGEVVATRLEEQATGFTSCACPVCCRPDCSGDQASAVFRAGDLFGFAYQRGYRCHGDGKRG